MKDLIVTAIFLVSLTATALAETPGELARSIIKSKIVGGFYVAGMATPKEKQDVYRALLNSKQILEQYMLSSKVPEQIRISFAISILSAEILNSTSTDKEKLISERFTLGKRLVELAKSAEQDAAANP